MQVQVETLRSLSKEDIIYISKWMAKTYHTRDAALYVTCGVTYDHDPLAHELMVQAYLERAGAHPEMEILVTRDRNAVCLRCPPGCKWVLDDFDYRSGDDTTWDIWVARVGGRAAIEERCKDMSTQFLEQEKAVWGANQGLDHFRAYFLGSNPDFHKQGLGKAIILKIFTEAQQAGVKALFGAAKNNIPMYVHLGARPVGKPIQLCQVLPSQWRSGWDSFSLMEYGRTAPKSKL